MSDRRRAPAGARRRCRRAASTAVALLSTAVLTGGVEAVGARWPEAVPVAGAGPDWRPARVRIPAIRVDSPLEVLGLDAAGALRAPVDYARAGWYAGGTAPGDAGPAVLAGHVDSRTGPAVFFRLDRLRAGDPVQVLRGNRWLTFRVVATARYAKDRFPTEEVYGPTPDPQLRLITCGGSFDAARRSYADNIVVYAVAE